MADSNPLPVGYLTTVPPRKWYKLAMILQSKRLRVMASFREKNPTIEINISKKQYIADNTSSSSLSLVTLILSDNIPARSFALLTYSKPLAYIIAQLYRASPFLTRFYEARGMLD